MSLDKYNHSEVENRIYAYWERNNLFKPKKNKKPIVVDPKSTNFEKYKGATIITPNIKELEQVVKKKLDTDYEIEV